ncbi:glycosyltransferase family 2 protein [Pelagibius marinus]|uniref:glycosyltransferase family 2 protein n=1 Tax=Pelagibius marinus TaxID=2762760 RepID=UPI001D057AFF|nr:glycosyltransferase family 2 protein [Pelagibius marinus]
MSFRACIVVPVYNHATQARALVERLAEFGKPVIIVNDGSGPADSEILKGLAQEHATVSLFERPANGGKGAAVKDGLKEASRRDFSHALQIDADGQHDVNDVPKFLARARSCPDAVITGQPLYDESVPRGRLIARYLTHVWVWVETLSFTIRDSMCGFRVYPLQSVANLLDGSRLGDRMDFDPEVLVRLSWNGIRIISLPTRVRYPEGGLSHFRLFEDNLLITRMHIKLVAGMLWRLPVLLSRKFLPGFTADRVKRVSDKP